MQSRVYDFKALLWQSWHCNKVYRKLFNKKILNYMKCIFIQFLLKLWNEYVQFVIIECVCGWALEFFFLQASIYWYCSCKIIYITHKYAHKQKRFTWKISLKAMRSLSGKWKGMRFMLICSFIFTRIMQKEVDSADDMLNTQTTSSIIEITLSS